MAALREERTGYEGREELLVVHPCEGHVFVYLVGGEIDELDEVAGLEIAPAELILLEEADGIPAAAYARREVYMITRKPIAPPVMF